MINIEAVKIVEDEGGGRGSGGGCLKLMKWVEAGFCDMCLRPVNC